MTQNGYHKGLKGLLLPHKQTAKNKRANVKESLPHRVVAYSPDLARILGGVTTGAYFSQLMFLSDKGNDPEGWIYKSEAEMSQETGLTKREQQTARKKLLNLGVIELKRGGWRNTYHFRIVWEKLIQVIADYQQEQTGGTGGVNQQTGGTEYPQWEQRQQNGTTPTTEQPQNYATECPHTSTTERGQTDSTQWQQNATPQDRDYNRENKQERTTREQQPTQTDPNETKEIKTIGSAQQAWNLTLTRLKEQVPASTFTTWIKDTVLVGMERGTAYVLVGSQLAKEWLERRLYFGICRALGDVLHQDGVEVQFVTA
jgi:hypothetical protein